ncbi:hypothetical protein V5O48_017943 [Marasmius crinis-equi]|uniref:HTH CENPB-type domain-containing protein n=1 Tax=Marasmius crinis-equi TaxID=585013 RepID=A0ABR3EMJ5_9AGAR
MTSQKTRKVRTNQRVATAHQLKKPHKSATAPKTTAKPLHEKKEDLTLANWLEVFDYMDAKPGLTQQQVVNYFASRPSGVLSFKQSALSKKLQKKDELRARVASHPNALLTKRAHVVTRPDVNQALALWQDYMEGKQETVTGPMLIEKRKRFEVMFDVPEDKRLKGTGWLASFKEAYKSRRGVALEKLHQLICEQWRRNGS